MSKNRREAWINGLSYAWLFLFTGLGLGVLLHRSDASVVHQRFQSNRADLNETEVARSVPTNSPYGHRNIEDIRVGDRVLAANPEVSDEERAAWREPDWRQWQHASLEMTKPDGGTLKIEMLRPREWFEEAAVLSPILVPPIEDDDEQRPQSLVGTEIWLDLPEMGAEGPARLLAVSDCPPIRSGAGQVVTATFAHPPSTDVLDVQFEGEPQPIGVTDNHLFWSVDRDEFLPIGDMPVGDRVLTYFGDTKRIEAKLARPGPELVYNLEVYGEHVYGVGETALLAHNTYTNKAMRRAVNELDAEGYRWYQDPFTNQRKRTRLRLAPDHIFPAKRIEDMANDLGGWRNLTRPQQLELLTDMQNIQGLPYRLNSSKGAQTALQFKKALGRNIDPNYRRSLRAREIEMEERFRKRITSMLGEKR